MCYYASMKMLKEKLFSKEKIEIGPESGYDNYIMAIESSCDETACAIVKNGREVVANVVASQIKTHEKYGGVIPEIAAREHLESINVVIDEAFKQAKANAGINPEDIHIPQLLERIQKEGIKEVILAVKPSVEGETTSLYISKMLKSSDVVVSKIAHGVPLGADIDYVDSLTLELALENRKKISNDD